MRYSRQEQAYIVGEFTSGDTVTVSIYRLSDNALVVDSDICTEIGNSGFFKFLFSQEVSQQETFLWIMTNGSVLRSGMLVFGGYMDAVDSSLTKHRAATEESRFLLKPRQETVIVVPPEEPAFLLTEDGDFLLTESGDYIITEG